MKYKLYFDGNKTPKGVTCTYVVVTETGERIIEETIPLPQQTTSNQAEYYGLINGIKNMIEYFKKYNLNLKEVELEIFGDSQLVIKQLTGEYECRDPELRILRSEIRNLLTNFLSVNFYWIPREQNLAR